MADALQKGPVSRQTGRNEVNARFDLGPDDEFNRRPGAVDEGAGVEERREADDGGDEASVVVDSTSLAPPPCSGLLVGGGGVKLPFTKDSR